jgi:hypothetical protein
VKEHAEAGNPQSVIDAIDTFCETRRMMNVGATKGPIVDEQIRQKKPRVMAELGSYSGYSTVRFASLQREVAGAESHYYAFEFSPTFAEIVREMVAFAGLADHVTVFVGPFAENLHKLEGKTVDVRGVPLGCATGSTSILTVLEWSDLLHRSRKVVVRRRRQAHSRERHAAKGIAPRGRQRDYAWRARVH